MNQTSILSALRATGIIAVLRAPSAGHAIRAVDALVAGGITGIEITYSTPEAAEAIREIDERHGEKVYLGAGTILTAAQAKEAVDAGARFLVSPGTDPSLAEVMVGTGVGVILGALTPLSLIHISEPTRLGMI